MSDQNKIMEDPDYIDIKRFDFSLKKLLERYPDGCPNRIIAKALDISEEEVEAKYEEIVQKLRTLINNP